MEFVTKFRAKVIDRQPISWTQSGHVMGGLSNDTYYTEWRDTYGEAEEDGKIMCLEHYKKVAGHLQGPYANPRLEYKFETFFQVEKVTKLDVPLVLREAEDKNRLEKWLNPPESN